MRVLCCLDGTNVEQVSKATEMLLATQSLTFRILYVIDTGPRKAIEHTRERFLRPPGPPEYEMQQAEQAAAQDWTAEKAQPCVQLWVGFVQTMRSAALIWK